MGKAAPVNGAMRQRAGPERTGRPRHHCGNDALTQPKPVDRAQGLACAGRGRETRRRRAPPHRGPAPFLPAGTRLKVGASGGGHDGVRCGGDRGGPQRPRLRGLSRDGGAQVKVVERRPWWARRRGHRGVPPGFRNSSASYTVSLLNPKVIRDLDLHGHGLRIVERRAMNFLPPPRRAPPAHGRGPHPGEFAKFSAGTRRPTTGSRPKSRRCRRACARSCWRRPRTSSRGGTPARSASWCGRRPSGPAARTPGPEEARALLTSSPSRRRTTWTAGSSRSP
jgi:hypothetical protein